jgi:PAS domain S-box-containing protein
MKDSCKMVLLVADNPSDYDGWGKQDPIGDNDCAWTSVSSLDEAKEKLQQEKFPVVVAELYLRGGFGTDLIPFLPDPAALNIIINGQDEENVSFNTDALVYNYLYKDQNRHYLKLLSFVVEKSLVHVRQVGELIEYRKQLDNFMFEKSHELTEMYNRLQESETNFSNIFYNAIDGMIVTDFGLNFIEANEAIIKQFGVTLEYLCGHNLNDFLIPVYKGLVNERVNLISNRIPTGNTEIEIRLPDSDKIVACEISSVPIVFNHNEAILTIVRDITERKYLAKKLLETIVQTEEQERTRIARDLHDEIGPLVSALKIFVTSFAETDEPGKKEKLSELMGVIARDLIDSVKSISNDMSPHVLTNFGLLPALQNTIGLFTKDLKIKLSSNIAEMRFPNTFESVVYRIFKELINNTVKHAQASNVYIDIDYADSALVCNYRDDGQGFDVDRQMNSKSKGMGINNIITRIHSLGGEYDIKSEPGKGFEVNFIFQTNLIDANREPEK